MFRVAGLLAVTLIQFINLVELHGASGQRVFVNVMQITSIREPIHADLKGNFAVGARCIIVMVNGKFIAVREPCEVVRHKVGFSSPM